MRLEIDPLVTLRGFAISDAEAIARHADDRDVASNLRDVFPHPYSIEDALAYIESTRSADPETSFAITHDGEAIGTVGIKLGADIFRRSAEIGFWIGRDFWGKGIASRAVDALSSWAFESFDLARLFAIVFEHNRASARVLEKAGFELESRSRLAVTKEGETFDALIYARFNEGDDSG